jgi:hypothetical protein
MNPLTFGAVFPFQAAIHSFRAFPSAPGEFIAPENSVLPSISGSLVVGQTLTKSAGSWLNNPTTITQQWFKLDPYTDGSGVVYTDENGEPYWAGTNINLGTALTQALTSAERGYVIAVNEIATNAAGSTTARSIIVGPVI